jgi:S1-C subfamily serine protease
MQDYSGYGQPPIGAGGFGGPTGPMGPTSPLPPPRPPRRRVGLLSYIGVALAAGALGAGTVVALYHPAASSSSASAQPSSSAVAPAPAQTAPSSPAPLPSYGGAGLSASEAAILKKVEPGLVIINTTLTYNSELAAGTGMVISPDGLVLTNNHVIENSTKITATVVSTGRTYPAKVVGYDVTGDVAEIKLTGASGLHTIPIGDSAKVKSGDAVLAMGNANGQSQIVPAPGQVTGVNQTITASDQGGTVSSETLHGMIETNADIISGDSGGPLANAAGDVIGMDTAGGGGGFNEQQSSTGYAIPINTALKIAGQISAGQASSTIVIGYPPFIGIYIGQGSSASPQTQAQEQEPSNGGFGGGFGNGSGYGPGGSGNAGCYTSDANLTVPSTIAPVNSGTLVLGTICGSPAASAGLTAGSVITAVNGQSVGAPQSLTSIMSKFKPGASVSLSWVTPSGQDKTGQLTLTPGPPL